MKSRFLVNLDSEIAVASDRIVRACLQAERAAYLARLGDVSGARSQLSVISKENAVDPSIRVSILANIADGLCYFYDDMGQESLDRFMRGRALSIAAGQRDLQARAASWLAHLAYGRHRVQEMVGYLREALLNGISEDSLTASRVCLVIAQGLHIANRFELASRWYERSRTHGSRINDDALTSAHIHNMSSITCVNYRNFMLGGIVTTDSIRSAAIGANSTGNFDELIGAKGLEALTPLMQAQIHSLAGRFTKALELYELHLDSTASSGLRRWQSWLLADKGWCNASLGNIDAARTDITFSLSALTDDVHLDDRAAILQRLSSASELIGESADVTKYRDRSLDAWRAFSVFQSELTELLSPLEDLYLEKMKRK